MEKKIFVEDLFKKYYSDREYEQIDLFRLLKSKYNIRNVIYPGSYVHISPSFIFKETVYVDSDKNAKKFYKNENDVINLICQRKEYQDKPTVHFYGNDYTVTIQKLIQRFDLMISQYAGFISTTCKQYLKIGGFLLVNNSHGDAGLASIDEDYNF